jgi:hypothetical protein
MTKLVTKTLTGKKNFETFCATTSFSSFVVPDSGMKVKKKMQDGNLFKKHTMPLASGWNGYH